MMIFITLTDQEKIVNVIIKGHTKHTSRIELREMEKTFVMDVHL